MMAIKTPDTMTTGLAISTIVTLDAEALARAWVDFNRWQWPRNLPQEAKPHWWDGWPGLTSREVWERKYGYITAFMDYAAGHVDDALIDAEWRRPATDDDDE